ncbi:MAG TPA: protein TolQ [Gammaproteobacteria bacterium]|nr:protein TolQ [Gammaproteobacteria bacterium]
MTVDSSLWTYFINASFLVKFVMALLIGASILSWTYILQRSQYLKKMRAATVQFEDIFWAGGDLSKLYADSMKHKSDLEGMESIFHAGFKEFLRLHKQPGITAEAVLASARRAMNVATMREQDKMEVQLPTLATIGSTSPFVGIFGTVCGIMLTFRTLAHVQQATISMVAPGIAEALIATAMGLFAAIPAVVAYNRFTTDINRMLNRFDVFQEEFSNILFRQVQTTLNNANVPLNAANAAPMTI